MSCFYNPCMGSVEVTTTPVRENTPQGEGSRGLKRRLKYVFAGVLATGFVAVEGSQVIAAGTPLPDQSESSVGQTTEKSGAETETAEVPIDWGGILLGGGLMFGGVAAVIGLKGYLRVMYG